MNGNFETPRNYFVPNFGKDQEVLDVEQSLHHAVKSRKKHFKYETPWVISEEMVNQNNKLKRDYSVPNFGVDEDILVTQGNIALGEK